MEKRKITNNQSKDTGIVLGLVMLYIGISYGSEMWLKIAMVAFITALLIPKVFFFPAVAWFGLAEILGGFVSKIVLGIIYILIIMPVGILRRLLKKDTMMLNDFKAGKISSWIVRDHNYTKEDIHKPY